MATDFNKPIVTDAYANILPGLATAHQDLARMLEPTLTGTSTNIPTGAVRWNAATIRWERYNGTSWVTLPAAGDNVYAISISGNAATATNATTAEACSGNAATATKLATARTIGGVSFDGSANINLPGVNSQGSQNTTGKAANLTPNPAGYTHIGDWGQPGGAANTFLVNRAYMSDTCTGNAATASNAIGVGQSWVDVKASRSLGSVYTNSTGRTIAVSVTIYSNYAAPLSRYGVVGGSVITREYGETSQSINSVILIVKDGGTYQITLSYSGGSPELMVWQELR